MLPRSETNKIADICAVTINRENLTILLFRHPKASGHFAFSIKAASIAASSEGSATGRRAEAKRERFRNFAVQWHYAGMPSFLYNRRQVIMPN